MKRKRILIPFYWDEEAKVLYAESDGNKVTRTQFFSDEQLREFHKQTKPSDEKTQQPCQE